MNPENSSSSPQPQYYVPAQPQQAPYNAPGMPAASFTPDMPQIRRKRRHWPWILLVLVVLLVAGAGASYAFFIAPSSVFPTALMGKYTQNHATIKVSAQSTIDELDGAELSISLDGQSSETGEADLGAAIRASAATYGGLSFEFRFVKGTLYMILTEYPGMLSPYVSSFANKWFSLKSTTVDSLEKTSASTKADSEKEATMSGLYDSMLSKGVVDRPRFVGFGMESGKYVKKYEMAVHKEKFIEFANENSDIGGDSAQRYLDSAEPLDGVSSISPVSFAVDLFSNDLRSVSFDVKFETPSSFGTSVKSAGSELSTLSVRLLYMPELFKPVRAPEGATPLDEMLKGFFGGVSTSTTSMSR